MTNYLDKDVSGKPSSFYDTKIIILSKTLSEVTSNLLLDEIKVEENKKYNISYNKKTETVIFNKIENLNSLKKSDLENIIVEILLTAQSNGLKVEKIDLSKIMKIHNIKKYINGIISNNYPILNIHRFIDNSEIINFRFSGIKNLNDEISKEFSDLFINEIKIYLEENFKKNNSKKDKKGRLVGNNYKNITFSIIKGNFKINELLNLDNFKNINEFISFIYKKLDKKSKEQILGNSKISNDDEIKKFLYTYLKIGIGIGKIEDNSISGKIETQYKSFQSNKENILFGDNNLTNYYYDFNNLKNKSNKISILKDEILKSNLTFSYKGIKNLKINLDGNINTILLNRIEKSKEIHFKGEGSDEIKKKIIEYINLLNSGFSYFIPTLKDYKEKDIDYIKDKDLSVRNGILDIKHLTKTFKGFYSKTYINKISETTKGTKIFIDIIGNQLENLKESEKAVEKIQNGTITSENINQLLNVCTPVTRNIIIPFEKLLKKYPELIISILGDEIYVFSENVSQISEILNNINSNFSENNIRIRITHTEKQKITFENLDLLTGINKLFEEKVEQSLSISLNKSLHLNISDDLKRELFNDKDLETKYNNLEYIFSQIDFTSKTIINFFSYEYIKKISLNIKGLEIILVKNTNLGYYEIIIK